jgi:hypothetical protein
MRLFPYNQPERLNIRYSTTTLTATAPIRIG